MRKNLVFFELLPNFLKTLFFVARITLSLSRKWIFGIKCIFWIKFMVPKISFREREKQKIKFLYKDFFSYIYDFW
jgi:hypothetical protein